MPETIRHILSKREHHLWSLYMERHNRVRAVVHYHLCTMLGFKAQSLGNQAKTGIWRTADLINRCDSRRRKPSSSLRWHMLDALLEERQSEKTDKYNELAVTW